MKCFFFAWRICSSHMLFSYMLSSYAFLICCFKLHHFTTFTVFQLPDWDLTSSWQCVLLTLVDVMKITIHFVNFNQSCFSWGSRVQQMVYCEIVTGAAWGAPGSMVCLGGATQWWWGVNHLISHFPWISSLARTIALEQQMDENWFKLKQCSPLVSYIMAALTFHAFLSLK